MGEFRTNIVEGYMNSCHREQEGAISYIYVDDGMLVLFKDAHNIVLKM